MTNDVDNEMIKMIAKITGFELNEIKPEMKIIEDLGVDSLKVIEIATAIEQKYKVVVKESQMAKIHTVGQSIKVVKGLLEKKKKQS